MSSGPKPPDPTATSNAQQQYNTTAGVNQQQLNAVNQFTPYGSLQYSQTMGPNGIPQFTASQTQAPGVQQASDTLLNNINSGAGKTTAQTQMDLFNQYYQPLIDQKQKQLNNSLWSQGIAPGAGGNNTAYNNAQNLFSRNVGDQQNSWLLNSLDAARQQQMLPYGQLAALRGATAPGFVNPPQAQIQPPNYSGLVSQNYQNQVGANSAMNTGLFGIGSALGGGWARGGFPGLSALGGAGGAAGTVGGMSDAALTDAAFGAMLL